MDFFKYVTELVAHSSTSAPEKGPHITRFQMYRTLTGSLAAHDGAQKTALSVSGSQRIAKVCGIVKAQLKNIQYPEYDILNLPFEAESFDFIFSDQVLEHVKGDIAKLYRDLARMLKPGGFMVHATPFICEIHPTPLDCWRFAPDGLRWLAEQADMEVVTCEGWGNRAVWVYIMLGHRMTAVPNDPSHPTYKLATYNEKGYPIVVWIICRKKLPA